MQKNYSYFKNKKEDLETFETWVSKLEQTNGYEYDKFTIQTSLGKTQIYGINTEKLDKETLLIFAGFRTSSLIWDLDRGLYSLSQELRIFLVEINGQPNLSEGFSPSVKNLDYGKWGAEIFEQLKIESAFIAGASFGGLVCMKISLVIPKKIKSVFLLNPACFRMISFGMKNLYYNLLPIMNTSEKNIRQFLEKIVFHKPNHKLLKKSEDLLVEYLLLVISNYKDKTEKPFYMGKQLNDISVDTYLLVGKNDILFPPQKSIKNARKHLHQNLKSVKIFEEVGHGIECYKPCLDYIENTIKAQHHLGY